ncbi:signal peptide protein [Acinetobacter sp. HA]|nr:RcnB family protein [Acinetobacter sp. HA]EIM38267.1 signal peptide protein [Acinetobacter sp. HA]
MDHSKYKRLNKPGRNQQWIKVNGDYILMNVVNDKVIKIIAA